MAEEKVKADRPSQQDQSGGLIYAPHGPGEAHLRRRLRPRQVRRATRLVTFPKDRRVIKQEDLEECLLLERKMHESADRWKTKRDYILELLQSGARSEFGVHVAEIEVSLKVR